MLLSEGSDLVWRRREWSSFLWLFFLEGFSALRPQPVSKILFLMCLPDGRVSFYTSVGCDVFLFNYRGYGRSGGKASPSRINNDVREVCFAFPLLEKKPPMFCPTLCMSSVKMYFRVKIVLLRYYVE